MVCVDRAEILIRRKMGKLGIDQVGNQKSRSKEKIGTTTRQVFL